MDLERLKNILGNGTSEEMIPTFENLDSKIEVNPDPIFKMLCTLLEDENQRVRFFSLYYLINQFSELLSVADENLTNRLYNLIFDESGPVADRSIWALGITKNKGLDKLIKEYRNGTISVKERIVTAIGRSNFSFRSQDRMEILLDGIQSQDDKLRFNSMCEIMHNSPMRVNNIEHDNPIDFNKIYSLILPVAEDFQKINPNEMADRFVKWIKTNGTMQP